MEFSEVIRNRYSCKNFSGKEVEKEKLDQILEAVGAPAPTAKIFRNSIFKCSAVRKRLSGD
ncbi:MAG: nitroreductase family protein [Lachnospiraceae bacterium]